MSKRDRLFKLLTLIGKFDGKKYQDLTEQEKEAVKAEFEKQCDERGIG